MFITNSWPQVSTNRTRVTQSKVSRTWNEGAPQQRWKDVGCDNDGAGAGAREN